MDVDDICDIDNNVSHEDEIHGSREDVNGNTTVNTWWRRTMFLHLVR